MQTILILTANPQGTSQLRLDREVRDIEEGLLRAKQRDRFVIESKLAVRTRDIQRAMLESDPAIVHFSGHGTGDEGLVFEDETGSAKLVDGEALAGLFELFADRVECVVLNGCYSEVQAEAIAQHINYVIGMKKAIGDQAAIEYAVGFYDALGSGKPVEFAHKLGCVAIRLAGVPEQLTPTIKKKPNIDVAGTAKNSGEQLKFQQVKSSERKPSVVISGEKVQGTILENYGSANQNFS
jgi:CHAT domain